MNRLSFLKKLGIGAMAIVVAPKVTIEQPRKKAIPVISPKSGKVYSVIPKEPYKEDDGDFTILHVRGRTFRFKMMKSFRS